MFKVSAHSLEEYLAFDPKRQHDLEQLDVFIKQQLPTCRRWFYDGIHSDTGGMRMQMIGYGSFKYAGRKGALVVWPVIGVALQKNYISVYVSGEKDLQPIFDAYRSKLGEHRSGHNNFSFVAFDDLNLSALTALFKDIEGVVKARSTSG